jgi:hypothetical protein
VSSVQVVISDDQDTSVVIDDPAVVAVVEVQIPGTQGPPGSGSSVLPGGGSTGQVLVKNSGADGDTGWATPDATQAELDAKLAKKGNGNVALDPTNDTIVNFRVAKDGSLESGWIDKLVFWFSEDGSAWTKTWFSDKFNQLRARAARDTEAAFVAYPKTDAATVDILKVGNADGSVTFLGVSKTQITATKPVIAPNLVPAILLDHGGSVPGGTASGTLIFEKNA